MSAISTMLPLAEGDINIPIPGGLAGIAIILILSATSVLTALLRRRRVDPDDAQDAVTEAARPALAAAVDATATALALQLADMSETIRGLQQTNDELEAVLDQAYQGGFKPDPPLRPRPHRQASHD